MRRRPVFPIALLMCISIAAQSQFNKAAASVRERAGAGSNHGLEAQIVAVEKRSWEAVKNRDYTTLASSQAEDYQEIDADGLRKKAQSLQNAKDLLITDYAMTEVNVRLLANHVALLTYKMTIKGSFKGQPLPMKPYYYGAVYVNQHGKWLVTFFQETLLQ